MSHTGRVILIHEFGAVSVQTLVVSSLLLLSRSLTFSVSSAACLNATRVAFKFLTSLVLAYLSFGHH